MNFQLLFPAWWLLENLTTHFCAYLFLLRQTMVEGKRHIPLWLAGNGALTLAFVLCRFPGAFWADVFFFLTFSAVVLKLPVRKMAIPAAVIFTLYTLKEGLSAVVLSWASQRLASPTGGIAEQLLLSALLVALFAFLLWMIGKRYAGTLCHAAASCLHLFLPCSFFVLLIRLALRLDSPKFAQYLSTFDMGAWMTALFLLAGAAALVFFSITAFCRIIYLSGQEKKRELLEKWIQGQSTYWKELKKESLQYASIQHDIKNHLLVLSGLLQERKLMQAEQYLKDLRGSYAPTASAWDTGHPLLDILLREKYREAESLQASFQCDIRIPQSVGVEGVDLCILFSNILDNAIAACQKEPVGQRFIFVSAHVRSNFLVLESENSASGCERIQEGIGLYNVRQTAEKYHGVTEIQLKDGNFRISVLLCLPFT